MSEARQRRLMHFNSSMFEATYTTQSIPQTEAYQRYNARSTVFDADKEGAAMTREKNGRRSVSPSISAGKKMPKRCDHAVSQRDILTHQSTVFEGPTQHTAVKNPNRIPDHEARDIFGDAPVDYGARAAQKESSPQFQPRYKSCQPRQAKNKELYGTDQINTFDKMIPNLAHALQVTTQPPKEEDIGAKERKHNETWQSQVGHQVSKSKYTPVLKQTVERRKAPKALKRRFDRPQESKVELETRTKDHNFSNLFGREFSKTFDNEPRPRSSQQRTHDPSAAKQMNLQSSFDRPCSANRPASTTPSLYNKLSPARQVDNSSARNIKQNSLYTSMEVRKEPAEISSFNIQGLKATDTADSIRQSCSGLHLVSVEPAMDDITGRCKGSAKVTMRHNPSANDLDKFKMEMLNRGCKVDENSNKVGKKNNYHLTGSQNKTFDNAYQIEDKRTAGRNISAAEHKMKLLQSTGDYFGNSEGVGRWTQNWQGEKQSLKNTDDRRHFETVYRWGKQNQSYQPPSPVKQVRSSGSSFMKPTISSTAKR